MHGQQAEGLIDHPATLPAATKTDAEAAGAMRPLLHKPRPQSTFSLAEGLSYGMWIGQGATP